MLRRIAWVSARFSVLLVTLAGCLMVAGVVQLSRSSTDVLPEIAPTVVAVQTEAPGLSAEEVESLVTVPLEKNLFEGVMGATDVTSDSVPGLSTIYLHFTQGTNIFQARQLVQERLTKAFVLPNVSKPPVMLQPVSSTRNVILIGLTSTRLSPIDLSVLARWTIIPRLLGVAGVADISTFGQADRQLQVLVDPKQLAADHVTLAQIIATAGDAQLVSPLSYLEASTPGTGGFLEDPNQRLTIRHVLPFANPANLAQVPVAEAARTQLGKVATVAQGHQPLIGAGVVHGGSGLVLVIQKLPSANVAAVTNGVDQALAELQPGMPGVRVDASLFRPATYVHSAFQNVRTALILAAVLAALALAALFLSFRLAFISLAGIAVSLVSGTLVFYLLGYSFNALVALGVVLALAVVTDDAVGAARSLQQRIRARRAAGAGEDAVSLATMACSQFRGALCTATLAILLSAAPLYFSAGPTATFLRPMILAFALAVAASMVVALTVTPALAVLVFSAGHYKPHGQVLARHLGIAYRDVLRRALRIPRTGLAAIGAVTLGGLLTLVTLHPQPPAFQDRNLVVRLTGAPGMSLSELDRITALASHELAALPAVSDVGATLGRAVSSGQVVNTNTGQIWVTVRQGADYSRALAALRAIATGTPGVQGTVGTYESASMPGVLTAPAKTVNVRIYGPSYAQLAQLATQVTVTMTHLSGVQQPHFQLPIEQPTINVEVNLDKAVRDGVKPGDIRREVATLVSGLTVGNFFQDQKVFDVVVLGTPAVRGNLSSLRNLLLDTVNGGHVRLGDLATISVRPDPADIRHQAMARYLDVTAQVSGRSQSAASAAVAASLRAVRFPVGYSAQVTNDSAAGGTSGTAFAGYVVAALIGILLLAQAALGTWRRALIVMAALPGPIAVAALTAVAIGAVHSLAAATGLLAVFAIALRQAIRVAAAIRYRSVTDDGEPPAEIAVRGATDAAGPVLASAAVTAAALLPFIFLGNVAGLELLHTAAAVILGGLITATLLNLVVLPVACLWAGPAAGAPEQPEELAEVALAPPPVGQPS